MTDESCKKLNEQYLEGVCDAIFQSSIYSYVFDAEDSEVSVEDQVVKYYDQKGNTLVIEANTFQITYVPAVGSENRPSDPARDTKETQ